MAFYNLLPKLTFYISNLSCSGLSYLNQSMAISQITQDSLTVTWNGGYNCSGNIIFNIVNEVYNETHYNFTITDYKTGFARFENLQQCMLYSVLLQDHSMSDVIKLKATTLGVKTLSTLNKNDSKMCVFMDDPVQKLVHSSSGLLNLLLIACLIVLTTVIIILRVRGLKIRGKYWKIEHISEKYEEKRFGVKEIVISDVPTDNVTNQEDEANSSFRYTNDSLKHVYESVRRTLPRRSAIMEALVESTHKKESISLPLTNDEQPCQSVGFINDEDNYEQFHVSIENQFTMHYPK